MKLRFLQTGYVALLLGTASWLLPGEPAVAREWSEGTHYVSVSPAQHTVVAPGKIEVMEVFSYGCIACNGFQPVLEKLKHALPPTAQLVLLPASFNAAEDWPMLQRAYLTARVLGIAERTHQSIYDAIWKSGELAIVDSSTHALKHPQPSIKDAARCYERLTGVTSDQFLKVSQSFQVDFKMRAADAQIGEMQVPSTPCIVVNGKYRLLMDSVRSDEELIDLVKYLVAKAERG
jgi:protein dithiol oxidoreductase (disulfide-forming)